MSSQVRVASGVGGPSLQDGLVKELAHLSPAGDVRAFALSDVTFVVRWTPLDVLTNNSRYYRVQLRLKNGNESSEHETLLADLSILPRWAEHHARCLQSRGGVKAPAPARLTTTSAPTLPAVTPIEMLRARLQSRR